MLRLILILLFTTVAAFASAADTGTLIVSYSTGDEPERLDRIRFLLISPNNDESMYPKNDSFVETDDSRSRLVAIENLPVGMYRVRFVVPNTDNMFDRIPDIPVKIEKDEITRIDQVLSPRHPPPSATDDNLTADNVAGPSYVRRYPGGIVINQVYAQITVTSNMPSARWTLMRDDTSVYTGVGSVTNYQVPDGDNYRIVPEPIDGYSVRVNQPSTFRLYPTQTTRISIVYERTHGSLNIRTVLPANATATAHISSPGMRTLDVKLKAHRDGTVNWVSQLLPTGQYEVTYEMPSNLPSPPPERFVLHQGERKILTPELLTNAVLHVVSNVPEAIFFLRSMNDTKVWQGSGREYTFVNITPGTYLLTFSSQEPDYYIPPKEMRIAVSNLEHKEIKVNFQIAGKLAISTNIEQSSATIQEIGGQRKTYQEQIQHFNKTLPLPEGKYSVTLSSASTTAGRQADWLPPESTTVNVPAFGTTEINLPFQQPSPEAPKEKQQEEKPVPPPKDLKTMASIPAGKAIIGAVSYKDSQNELPSKIVEISAFTIGVYEITNGQFADWLNMAISKGTIVYLGQGDKRGHVIDDQGHLLFKTFEADPYSQISAQQQTVGTMQFIPIPGKDLYPVIDVSWYGAIAYCRDNTCRLPTEAEWEKAASMAPEQPGSPLKKYIFGFGQDHIDRSWANYKDSSASIKNFQVLTTPVGFYDGINTLPLDVSHPTTQKTNLAKSPYGAFDMSGNVWEWVSDWYDDAYTANMVGKDPQGPASGTLKTVKGGCYDSLADGVRVTERLGLPPDHTDSFTGFRVAR